MPTPENVHFIGWTMPVASAVAAVLLREVGQTAAAFDFTGHVVVVPTRESGRRLLVALAAQASEAGLGVLAPEVFTPDVCLRTLVPRNVRVASPLVACVEMAAVLHAAPEGFPALFPAAAPEGDGVAPSAPIRDWAWAVAMANVLLDVRATLANSPAFPDFATVCANPDTVETERWTDMARVETAYRARLSALGLTDAADARHAGAFAPQKPAHWRRLWLAATPALTPLLPVALGKINTPPPDGTFSISVLIAAPEAMRSGFDAWGRVEPAFWKNRPIDWEDFAAQTQLAATPNALADAVAAMLPRQNDAGRWTSVGVPARALVAGIKIAAERVGIPARSPEGETMRQLVPGVLLHLWGVLLSGEETRAVSGFLRLPDFVRMLAPEAKQVPLLREWDALWEKRLPDSLPDMLEFAPANSFLANALGALDRWRRRIASGDWADALRDMLAAVFAERVLDSANPADRAIRESIETILEEIRVLAPAAARYRLPPETCLALVLHRLALTRVVPDPVDTAVPLLGWLELLWDDAPHLILAGLNDEHVPECVTADPFLPGSFREKLGLPSNDARLAESAYIFQKLLAQRASGSGRVNVFVLQTGVGDTSLRPSRLLFLADNAVLPDRVRLLFADPSPPNPESAWRAGWRYVPTVTPDMAQAACAHISVTSMGDYLKCPFRFFLKNVAKMRPFDPWKMEPDAMEFGSAIHDVLATFASDEHASKSEDAEFIAAFTAARLDEWIARAYGARRPLPVLVFAEAARNRLSAFARAQAQIRAQGWRIVDSLVEVKFATLLGRPFRLDEDGLAIQGKIDRIDLHDEQGWRIMDYKTSQTPLTPHEAHLENVRKDTPKPEYTLVGNSRSRWRNLQLPLYSQLFRLARNLSFNEVTTAYFNLPKALSKTTVSPWSEYTRELDDSAVACARGVLNDIRSGVFWPPAPFVKHDDFGTFLFPSPETVVDSEAFRDNLSQHWRPSP
ncbi:MAG: PD-(D/E)XK nuclease family protein [Puniceicoccales bacterium]|jgi:ATP-dependent helicase/nuclease subunit B|nr:PD-(D/E)XK nuclease family protein [Puniceicoccales bacterium]